jgi:membrane-bound metal-dependent hydrolase YbcI (DUF457 family)
MAGFKTHIGTSTLLGVGYGAAGYLGYQYPWETCALGGGLCSLAGMLPDLDSDSGFPVREVTTLLAAVTPMLMLDRFQHLQWSQELIVLAAAGIYFAVRFGVAEIFKRFTVHRGMWHSIPAMFTAGLLAFLLCSGEDLTLRVFKAGGVVLGFFSHLLLDEIWAFQFRGLRPRLKSSFGTALKLWGPDPWANFSTYAKLALVAGLAVGDPVLMTHWGYHPPESLRSARQMLNRVLERDETQLR